jgi:hypothetical protein
MSLAATGPQPRFRQERWRVGRHALTARKMSAAHPLSHTGGIGALEGAYTYLRLSVSLGFCR